MDWSVWVIIGIICLILEIFTPSFFFFSIGFGAMMTGLLNKIIVSSISWQLLIFAIVTIIAFTLMKKFARLFIKPGKTVESNIFALVGKTGRVTQEILPGKKGYVKIEGEEWSAVATDPNLLILVQTSVKIDKLEGNKVFVSP